MRIDGAWVDDESGVPRPVAFATLLVSGQEYPVNFQVDTGADETVLGSDFALILAPHKHLANDTYITTPAGALESYHATVRLVFSDVAGRKAGFELSCAVLTDPGQPDTHLLGRDILNEFVVIFDPGGDLVTLLRAPHTYTISPR